MAARRRVDAETPVAAYEYDGLNRRIRKVVACSGEGIVPGSDAGGIDGIQAGNLNEHYYYAGWRVIEERDNSAFCGAQTVYGTEYIDAPVCRDRNTDVTAGGSPDDDCLDSGGSARGAVATTVRVPTFAIENRRSFARIRTSPRMRANSRHPGASRITSSPHPAPTPYDP